MINIISFLFAIGVGFGLSFWIFGTILEKSNNIGDSIGDKADYQAYVNFTSREDRISNSERQTYSSRHSQPIEGASQGPSGSEQVRRLSDEEIAKYDAAAKKEAEVKVPVSRPAAGFNDTEDEFRKWESQQYPGNTSGPFKPVDGNQ